MLRNAFENVATENTLSTLKTIAEGINESNENIEELIAMLKDTLHFIYTKMPALSRNGAVEVATGINTMSISTSLYAEQVATAFNMSTSSPVYRYRHHEAWNNSDVGAMRLYNNIEIS